LGGWRPCPGPWAEGAWEQQATLHRVTREIDRGEIVATRSYRLDPRLSYRRNEDRAYEAGMELLLEVLAHCEGEASKKV
jgi:methionyl-tRNA formyltransferase